MYPKEAWKFKLWTEAMLRGAHVAKPQYKSGKSTGSRVLKTRRKRHRRRKKKQSAT